eukprot:TRINITY_DN17_c0_g1_i8.p1 TRINITY_DN17_c0_g1~~TRINITY_DN17_c0_g1_i8.p1  ORF type:complete len:303 (+),score=2.29 TRINITY_DN17_c0_g1_i8:73-981(+)
MSYFRQHQIPRPDISPRAFEEGDEIMDFGEEDDDAVMGDAEAHTPDAPTRGGDLPRMGGRPLRPEAPAFNLGETRPSGGPPPGPSQQAAVGGSQAQIRLAPPQSGVSFDPRIPGVHSVALSVPRAETQIVPQAPPARQPSSVHQDLARTQAQLVAKEAEIARLQGELRQQLSLAGGASRAPPQAQETRRGTRALWEPSDEPPLLPSGPSVFDRLGARPSALDRLGPRSPGMPTNATIGRQPGMDRAVHDFFEAGGDEPWSGPRTGRRIRSASFRLALWAGSPMVPQVPWCSRGVGSSPPALF